MHSYSNILNFLPQTSRMACVRILFANGSLTCIGRLTVPTRS